MQAFWTTQYKASRNECWFQKINIAQEKSNKKTGTVWLERSIDNFDSYQKICDHGFSRYDITMQMSIEPTLIMKSGSPAVRWWICSGNVTVELDWTIGELYPPSACIVLYTNIVLNCIVHNLTARAEVRTRRISKKTKRRSTRLQHRSGSTGQISSHQQYGRRKGMTIWKKSKLWHFKKH